MMRELEVIERKYTDEAVMIIVIHSAKFSNEQESKNVKSAVDRYEISHPVIVDKEMQIWRSYGVTGWPTVVIIDPVGRIAYQHSGEG